MDEAGRGPLAGPLVACAVLLRQDAGLPGVDDSKRLTDSARRALVPLILDACELRGTGVVEPGEIDSMGMAGAVAAAFERASAPVAPSGCLFLVDGLPVRGFRHPAEFVVGGDGLSLSIAAASVLAKVLRDDIMVQADRQWPGYGFASNKGYGSRSHLDAIRRLGPCPIHRMSFRPLSPGLFDV